MNDLVGSACMDWGWNRVVKISQRREVVAGDAKSAYAD
jgi:hypothetical protein